jgi:hypothetical protein
MADSMGIRFDTKAWSLAVAEMHVLPDRAVMWALREAGRQVKRKARARAPHDTGQLADSIASSKRLKKFGPHMYGINVGPHGKSHLYSKKAEQRQPYMDPAAREVAGKFRDIHEKAMARALAKYRK